MSLIEKISSFINMFGTVAIVTLVGAIAVLYYLLKIKKVASREENINTSHFRKEDSIHYVPIKDVVSNDGTLDGVGMFVIDDYNFVAGVSVRGFDYPAASHEERIDAQVGSVQFFNVVEKPTSFRHTVRAVDLSHNIEEHNKIAKKLAAEKFDLEADYRATIEAAEEYLEEPEIYARYSAKLDMLQKKIFSKTHMLDEVTVLLEYMNAMSGDTRDKGGVGQKASQIMFSYTYNPDEYAGKLSREEVYLKAFEQLDTIAKSYIEALASCHFKAKRLTAREIIGLARKHTSPVTGEYLNLDDLLDSSYTTLFVSSDSLVEAYKEKIGKDVFERKMQEYYDNLEMRIERERQEREEGSAYLHQKAYNMAVNEMQAAGQEV